MAGALVVAIALQKLQVTAMQILSTDIIPTLLMKSACGISTARSGIHAVLEKHLAQLMLTLLALKYFLHGEITHGSIFQHVTSAIAATKHEEVIKILG